MSMNPIIMFELGKARQRDLLSLAGHDQPVIREIGGRPNVTARLLDKLGGFMIKAGKKLQIRPISQSIKELGLEEL